MRNWKLFSLALLMVGCGGSGQEFFPLEMGSEWTYQLRAQFLSGVESCKVQRTTSVLGSKGAQIMGPMGPTTLAWHEGSLISPEIGGTRFEPPIPLLKPSDLSKKIQWKGTVIVSGIRHAAQATISQDLTAYNMLVRKYAAIRTTCTLEYDGKSLETVSTYAQDIGLVKQEERLNGSFQASLEYLSGP